MYRTSLAKPPRRGATRRATLPRQAIDADALLPYPFQSRSFRLSMEELEDRRMLSVGSEFQSAFQAVQAGLDSHLFSASFSLPLVGSALGTDPHAQFLNALGQAASSDGDSAGTFNALTLQNDLAALVDPNHLGNIVNVTAPNGAQDGERA